MIFSSKTERWLYEKLKSGPLIVPELIRSKDISVTPEAIYLGIRNLIRDKLIIKRGKQVSLDLMMLEKISRELALVKRVYQDKNTHSDLLQEGERATYRFNDYESFDRFWVHTSLEYIINSHNEKVEPYLMIDSTYYWWSQFPRESFFFLELLKMNKFLPLLVFDERIIPPAGLLSKIRSAGAQVAFVSFNRHFKGFNVLKNMVMEITYPAETYKLLADIFRSEKLTMVDAKRIVESMSPMKIKLVCDKRKANALFKKYQKHFIL